MMRSATFFWVSLGILILVLGAGTLVYLRFTSLTQGGQNISRNSSADDTLGAHLQSQKAREVEPKLHSAQSIPEAMEVVNEAMRPYKTTLRSEAMSFAAALDARNETHIAAIKLAGIVLIDELYDTYPPEFFTTFHITDFNFVSGVALPNGSQPWGLALTREKMIIIDVLKYQVNALGAQAFDAGTAGENRLRYTIHHEIAHLVQTAPGVFGRQQDAAWRRFNPPSFVYQGQDETNEGRLSDVTLTDSPFVSETSKKTIQEDWAETYTAIMGFFGVPTLNSFNQGANMNAALRGKAQVICDAVNTKLPSVCRRIFPGFAI